MASSTRPSWCSVWASTSISLTSSSLMPRPPLPPRPPRLALLLLPERLALLPERLALLPERLALLLPPPRWSSHPASSQPSLPRPLRPPSRSSSQAPGLRLAIMVISQPIHTRIGFPVLPASLHKP